MLDSNSSMGIGLGFTIKQDQTIEINEEVTDPILAFTIGARKNDGILMEN